MTIQDPPTTNGHRPGRPALDDIPGQLRRLADRIESGEFGEVDSLFAVMPRDRELPRTFGWGRCDGAFEPIIQFELAHCWHIDAAAGLLSK